MKIHLSISCEMDLLEKNFLDGVIDQQTYDQAMDALIRMSEESNEH